MSIPAKVAAALAAAVLTVTLAPAAAQAAPDRSPAAPDRSPAAPGLDPADCRGHAVCLWRYPSFAGPMAVQRYPDRGCHQLPSGPALSVYNRTDGFVILFVGPSCEGAFDEVWPGGSLSFTGELVGSWAFHR